MNTNPAYNGHAYYDPCPTKIQEGPFSPPDEMFEWIEHFDCPVCGRSLIYKGCFKSYFCQNPECEINQTWGALSKEQLQNWEG